MMSSSKSIIDNERIPRDSPLKELYAREDLRNLVARVVDVLGPSTVHRSADPYNSAYYNVYNKGDGLGWHVDKSVFGVNLVLGEPEGGGEFEIDGGTLSGEEDQEYTRISNILAGRKKAKTAALRTGSLCIFSGQDSLHRVTKVTEGIRVNAILTFETDRGVSLSSYSRRKFFGRE